MTNNEAIEQLKLILETGVADADVLLYTEDYEAIDYAINSLAQKPCEDCISRQALRQKLQEHHDLFISAYGSFKAMSLEDKVRVDEIVNCIAMVVNEPSVTPQPKTGRWITQDIHNCHTDFKCSECGYLHSFTHLYCEPTADYTYCPNCGAKMEVEE